ncbi:hypothetical protein JCM8547_003563 [Rhodosporidiobolus lusitaniae]
MDGHVHAHLLRRQDISRPAWDDTGSASDALTSAQVAASSSPAAPIQATSAAVVTTSPQAASTSAAPTTTSDAAVPSSSSSSTTSAAPVVESSSSSTTTTEAVQSTTTTTSAAPTTTTTASSSTTTTEAEDIDASSTVTSTSTAASAFTTVVIVSGSSLTSTLSSSASLASSSSTSASSSSSDSGLSTGGVIGIVAGAVAGIVVLAAAGVWVFKKINRDRDDDDDDQVSPFDRDDFKRQSVMLDDVDMNDGGYASPRGGGGGMGFHSPQMSEHSLHSLHGEMGYVPGPMAAGMLGRSNTVLSGGSGGGYPGQSAQPLPGVVRGGTLHSPRPPTMIHNHYAHHAAHQQQQQQAYGAMPSFSPGQIVSPPPAAYGGFPDAYGGAPSPYAAGGLAPYPPQHAQANLDRSLTSASAGQWGNGNNGSTNLHRANSAASAYSQYSDGGNQPGMPSSLRPGMGGIAEEDERSVAPAYSVLGLRNGDGARAIESPSRSGTPVNSNPQQVFSSAPSSSSSNPNGGGHVRETSLGAFGSRRRNLDHDEEDDGTTEGAHGAHGGQGGGKRLSIRNGGLDAFEADDGYGGMH